MFTELQYKILKKIAPGEPTHMQGKVYIGKSKITILLGKRLVEDLRGKTVIDFGCGDGKEAIDLVQNGVGRVIGIDIREDVLNRARSAAAAAGISDKCTFTTHTDEKVDAIISVDAFEHFDDPAAILETMYDLLKPGGFVAVSFAPPWYHPYGGHLVSVFPWAHLVFTETALMRWRADIRSDGAKRFRESEGGLNQMTIAWFHRIVDASRFRREWIELVPIRPLRLFHNRLTREYTTSVVRCKLVKPSAGSGSPVVL